MIASPHYDRQSLMPELHKAADDMGEWALLYTQTRALGLIDNNLHRLAQEEAMRDKVLGESVQHFASCKGHSCRQGRMPCREKCIDTSGMEPGEFAEMACAPNEPEPITLRERLRDLRLRLMGRLL